jgi:hypothetical protein
LSVEIAPCTSKLQISFCFFCRFCSEICLLLTGRRGQRRIKWETAGPLHHTEHPGSFSPGLYWAGAALLHLIQFKAGRNSLGRGIWFPEQHIF